MKIDQRTSRAMNRRLILNLLRKEGAMSRADIATVTGLSPAAVTFVVSDLLDEQFLLEGNTTKGGNGRRPIPLTINYAGHLAIGIKMNVDHLECILTDLSIKPISSVVVEFANTSPEAVLDAAVIAVGRLQKVAEAHHRFIGIGFTMAGTIDVKSGICVRSHRFNWKNVSFAKMLEEKVKVPVWLEDDTIAFAMAHHLFGVGRQHKTFGALAIGVGIGCATVIEGGVHHGINGEAGKIGHIIHDLNGELCECGRHGCLQTYFSAPSLVERWRKQRQLTNVDRFAMKEAALAGDDIAIQILQEAGHQIGKHLASFIIVTDPEVIIVGGESVTFGDFLFAPLRASLDIYCLSKPPIIIPDERDDFWSSGAAVLATQQLFNFELLSSEDQAQL